MLLGQFLYKTFAVTYGVIPSVTKTEETDGTNDEEKECKTQEMITL